MRSRRVPKRRANCNAPSSVPRNSPPTMWAPATGGAFATPTKPPKARTSPWRNSTIAPLTWEHCRFPGWPTSCCRRNKRSLTASFLRSLGAPGLAFETWEYHHAPRIRISRRQGTLGSPPRLAQFLVEAQILPLHGFRNVHNLSIMQPEVLHHLVDGYQARHVVSLNLHRRHQVLFGQPCQHPSRFVHRCTQFRQHCLGRPARLFGELRRPVARVLAMMERRH